MPTDKDVVKRVRYFHGEFLQAEDFTQEQSYHVDRHRRHQRTAHADGIAHGLEVRLAFVDQAIHAEVAPGTAVDAAGRQIVVRAPLRSEDLSVFREKTLVLYLSYDERLSDESSDVGGHGHTRFEEAPKLEVAEEGTAPAAGADAVALTRVPIDRSGKPDLDPSVRRHAGLKLPASPNKDLTLRYRLRSDLFPFGHAFLDGNLAVSGLLAVGSPVDVRQVPRTGSHPSDVRGLYVTANMDPQGQGVEFRHTNGTQGIGFGYNTIYATGSNANQSLNLLARPQGEILAKSALRASQVLRVDRSIDFGTRTAQLINLFGTQYAIGIQSSTQYFRTAKCFAWHRGGSHHNEEGNAGGGTVDMVLNNGKLGLGGLRNPSARFDVASGNRSGSHPTNVLGLYLTSDCGSADRGVEFRHNNGTQGIGFGYNTIYATGSYSKQSLHLLAQSQGEIVAQSALRTQQTLRVDASIEFGTRTRQMINLWKAEYGIGIQGGTQYFRTARDFAWHRGGSHNDGDVNAGGGTVDMALRSGKLGLGPTNPSARLDVSDGGRTHSHPTNVRGLYVTSSCSPAGQGVEFRHSNGTQGIGFGYNTIYATGTNADQPLRLRARGKNSVEVQSKLTAPSADISSVGIGTLGPYPYETVGTPVSNHNLRLWSQQAIYFHTGGSNAPKASLDVNGRWGGSSREIKDQFGSLSAPEARDLLRGLNPVTFAYKADPEKKKHCGFIAEEVPDVCASPDHKFISECDITAIVTRVVKEHAETIRELSRRLTSLEAAAAGGRP